MTETNSGFDTLYATICERMQSDPDKSYVAALNAKGLQQILKKIGEEATEVVIAGKDEQADALIAEMADLWFHCLVLLAHKDISPLAVLHELEQRQGVSGLFEKASRKAS